MTPVDNCPTCGGTGLDTPVPGDLIRMCHTCMNGSHDTAANADSSSTAPQPTPPRGVRAQGSEKRSLGAADDPRIPAIRCGIDWAVWKAVDKGLGELCVGIDWHSMTDDELLVIAARALAELQAQSLEEAA